MIAIQLFERLKDLHSIRVVHNDIKPDNVLVDAKNGTLIHLIDFGLSYYFLVLGEDGVYRHKPKMNLNSFSGNFIFASLNSCLGNSKSRRDDLESAFYMIVFLLNRNNLPWMHLCSSRYSDSEKIHYRFQKEMMQSFMHLLKDCMPQPNLISSLL
jgi:serine/threonine protein kinase